MVWPCLYPWNKNISPCSFMFTPKTQENIFSVVVGLEKQNTTPCPLQTPTPSPKRSNNRPLRRRSNETKGFNEVCAACAGGGNVRGGAKGAWVSQLLLSFRKRATKYINSHAVFCKCLSSRHSWKVLRLRTRRTDSHLCQCKFLDRRKLKCGF